MIIHLKYGGSTATRTLACPGWVEKSAHLPPRPAGQAAIDGSMHHMVQELCQREGTTPADNLGAVYTEDTTARVFGDDDLDLSWIAYNATNKLLDELDIDELMVEPFVQLIPDVAGGSIDLLGLSRDRSTILVLDYKFGRGAVKVENNAQHSLYTLSAMWDKSTADMFYNTTRIVFAIVQPQLSRDAQLWETNRDAMEDFDHNFRAAMKATHLNPGDHCRYCPAEAYCEAKRTRVLASNLLGKDDLQNLQAAANMVDEVSAWVAAVREEMYLQMSRGVALEGWKVVDKVARRTWINESDAIKGLMKGRKLTKADIHETKLMSPAQIEKLVKKVKLDIELTHYVETVSSGTTMAPATDRREAVVVLDVQGHLAEMME